MPSAISIKDVRDNLTSQNERDRVISHHLGSSGGACAKYRVFNAANSLLGLLISLSISLSFRLHIAK